MHKVQFLMTLFSQLPCYDMIIPALLKYPIEELADHCKMTPGMLLALLLAKTVNHQLNLLSRHSAETYACTSNKGFDRNP